MNLLSRLDRTSWRYALRLALTCMVIVAIYQHFHLHNGYWAAFSVLGCIFPTAGQSFRRIKQRIIGTFLGMILGILVAHAAGTHWLYIDLFIPVFVFLTVYLKVFNYTFYALFNTIIAVMLVCLIAPGDWQIAYVRMEMTLLGCLIALAATYWLLPNRATEALPQQMQQLRLSLKTYYLSLIQPFLENDNAHSKTHRQSISQILEKTDAQLQEARYESWSWKHPLRKAQNPQEKIYNDLYQCYQTLLLLELEWPNTLQHANLQTFKPRLKEALLAIADLFDSKILPIDALKHSLQDMLSQVKAIRMKGAQDIRLPVATYHEHIQLTESLQHFLKLVTLFSALKK